MSLFYGIVIFLGLMKENAMGEEGTWVGLPTYPFIVLNRNIWVSFNGFVTLNIAIKVHITFSLATPSRHVVWAISVHLGYSDVWNMEHVRTSRIEHYDDCLWEGSNLSLNEERKE